jgi:hypothetical protein
MIKNILTFYRPASQWQAFSRGLGTLLVLSALSFGLTESDITRAIILGGVAIFFLALGAMFGHAVNKAVVLSFGVMLLGLIVYLVLTYQETQT